jgi:cytochrome c peroxidase
MLAARALAQFQRTLVSDDSRYDRWKAGRIALTPEEELGYSVFNSARGDCAVCHREPHFTTYSFSNIGLDSLIEGTGLGNHTGNPDDMGKWKIPSLRNLAFTAPYMHDGRFATLEDVIDFYETGGHFTATLDANIHNPDNPGGNQSGRKGLGLTQEERQALLAFLAALNDSGFISREF